MYGMVCDGISFVTIGDISSFLLRSELNLIFSSGGKYRERRTKGDN